MYFKVVIRTVLLGLIYLLPSLEWTYITVFIVVHVDSPNTFREDRAFQQIIL
jgi:hypothetical protein